MARKSKIILETEKIRAFHGCFEAEREHGTDYTVRAEIVYDFLSDSDDLAEVINYNSVSNIIHDTMAIPKNLIETVASDISHRIIQAFPNIKRIKTTVRKLTPPTTHPVKYFEVEIELP